MARTSLPPGFRFHPTDIELIMYYLKRKVMGKKFHLEAISELNIYKFSPWDLPDKSCLKSKDLEWYFFCPRERKYGRGERMKRGTETGYWKTTGKDRSIMYDGRIVGMVKTLVFHEGNAPRGKRSDWVVHEYRMEDKNLANVGVAQNAYVLYKVFKKNGPGPKTGAQYGAPFVEEEWDNDDLGIAIESLPSDGLSSAVIRVPENPNSASSKSLIDPVCASGLSLVEGGSSSVQPSSNKVVVIDGLNNSVVTDMLDTQSPSGWTMNGQSLSSARPSANDIACSPNDDIAHFLAAFTEDGTSPPNEQETYQLGLLGHNRENVSVPLMDGNDPFNGFEDLSTWVELSGGVNSPHGEGHNVNNMLQQDDMAFLELSDLDSPLNFLVDCSGFGMPTGSSYEECNPNSSEHILSGNSSTQYSFGADLGQMRYNVNFPCQIVSQRFSQCPVFPDSSGRGVDYTNGFPTGNAYGNILSQGYSAGYNLHSFSYRQPEESGDAVGNQERAGKLQRTFFLRLQWLLESFSAHPASVAEHLAPSNSAYGGSSIHVKAEVTGRFSACTKDALSVMLEESTCDYSCCWNLHGAEFWKKAADCSSFSFLFYFGLTLEFMWNPGVRPLFSAWLVFGECIYFSKMIDCFTSCTEIPALWNLLQMLSRFYSVTNYSFLLFMCCFAWFAVGFDMMNSS